ncbi:translation initiation factor IF-2 [Bacteroidales bacterium OttesenSCG-928-K03]|nr:translation initiation factor IF-2 [Odoribacter sp. OttesenSCG-928-L07]MDL2239438.1 translation initiation factor IF-2 [Bacteroidales bacterium OttesenSCG-928-L14]MDL2240559.1 translation initiation factor IF-2 [Bacteroidales bacterium OttesenSCG-928-K22]MDL2242659.1 translation initiation factor IF-2 [Bacteroidales bacterium OttesenSCG-928-K03]
MADETKAVRLNKIAKEFNVGTSTVIEFLRKKGYKEDFNPTSKLDETMIKLVTNEFQSDKTMKEESDKITLSYAKKTQTIDEVEKVEKVAEKSDTENDKTEYIIKGTTISTPKPVSQKPTTVEKTEQTPTISQEAEKESLPVDKSVEKKEEKEEKPAAIPTAKIEKTAEKEDSSKTTTADNDIFQIEIEKTTPKVIGKIDLDSVKDNGKKKKTAEKTEEKKKKTSKKEEKIVEEKVKKDITTTKSTKTATTETKVQETEKKPEIEEPKEVIVETATKEEVKEKETPKVESTPLKETKEEKVVVEVVTEEQKPEPKEEGKPEIFDIRAPKLTGPKIIGRVELPVEKPKEPKAEHGEGGKKKKRKRIKKESTDFVNPNKAGALEKPSGDKEKTGQQQQSQQQNAGKKSKKKKDFKKNVISDEEIQKQVSETLKELEHKTKNKSAKRRRDKRDFKEEERRRLIEVQEAEKSTLKVTEFVTVNELANLMNVNVMQVIQTCLNLGVIVSINQRLDAETMTVVADEFGYDIEFVDAELNENITVDEDEDEGDRVTRNPVVTVMGHVDHGKTSLLDNIRKTNVIAGEAGGITQHIGAYEVHLPSGRSITFLDTPGHEAFTAMRARGAKLTDIAIIVVAADDRVMPQTVEAINHAQAANVPIVIAINKIDKPSANPEKIKEELSAIRILVEDWGGKYQSQEISAKQGINLDLLLEKVLLEADMLDLKGNPNKRAEGTVIESSLDKGRGYVAKMLVQDGTLHHGDIVVAGSHYGKVKALFNDRNKKVDASGPSTPVLMLGLNGAPQAGDSFTVFKNEHDAKALANKRIQLQREIGLRTQKHITLDEIGRRIAIGDFKELNIIVKADVDGSIEALSDSLLKLSNPEVQVNVIHKSVGQITENDVMLASASNAIIVGFQVRPSLGARRLAEQEQIDIRTYSVIYKAIEEIKDAIQGMLSPEIEERITCNVEIREVYKISKVGSVAGCMVQSGVITRNTRIRLIRDGIVIYTGHLGSLKRFKDDAKEVKSGYECGLNIENFNDIKVGDIIEGFEEVKIQRTL